MREPKISVGISHSAILHFNLHSTYSCKGVECIGKQQINLNQGMIEWRGELYSQLHFTPNKVEGATNQKQFNSELNNKNGEATFTLYGVTIGRGFHWEEQENHLLQGELKVVVDGNSLVAINIIELESYLKSVISSEMSAHASKELLKAHAVLSRSWLLSQLERLQNVELANSGGSESKNCNEVIRWYDRQEHSLYNFCNDDHCQRYQGFSELTDRAVEAVEESRGEFLLYKGEICDARYSKCCGGYLEEFQNCWEDTFHPYLLGKRDWKEDATLSSLTIEKEAKEWIESSPKAFCNCQNSEILSQVLKGYDQKTTDFYRWSVEYNSEVLSTIVEQKGGFGLGEVINLIPLERGVSGRIVRLKIEGSKASIVIGKELEIRRVLSLTHLYSSAFTVERVIDTQKGITLFKLKGAGWGHGVGLCQIGAAVMGEKGYSYKEILNHYFSGVTIEKLY